MSDSFLVLLDSFLVVALTVQLVSVLLANFSDDVLWEAGVTRNLLCFKEKTLLHQSMDLNIVFHFVKFA